MGGKRVTVINVIREGVERDDLDPIAESVRSFKCSKCHCFDPDDKAKMLEVIRAAFGNLSNFDRTVRRLFKDTGLAQFNDLDDNLSCSSECSSDDICEQD